MAAGLHRLIHNVLLQAIRVEARTLRLQGTGRLVRMVYPPEEALQDRRSGIVSYHGLRLQVDTSRYSEWSVYMYGGYDLSGVGLLKSLVTPGSVVLDVGASVGLFTLPLSRRVGPQGSVHAFEPHPGTRQRLSQNLRLNNIDNVTVSELALGAEAGTAELYSPSTYIQGGACLRYWEQCDESFACRVATIDGYVREQALQHVDVIKVDVEGGDFDVLKGAEQTLREHRPNLFVEADDSQLARFGGSTHEMYSFLSDLGYEVWRNENNEFSGPERHWHLSRVLEGETKGFENWLAVHSERARSAVKQSAWPAA